MKKRDSYEEQVATVEREVFAGPSSGTGFKKQSGAVFVAAPR